MNQISVTEQPLLKSRDILIEVGKEQSPVILLADTYLQAQYHNGPEARSSAPCAA